MTERINNIKINLDRLTPREQEDLVYNASLRLEAAMRDVELLSERFPHVSAEMVGERREFEGIMVTNGLEI